MTKQQVIDECTRRLGDESAGFKAIISKVFDFVLLEIAQLGLLSMLRKQASFLLSTGTVTNGLIQYNTRTITGLAAPLYPSAIHRLTVPAWGPPWAHLTKTSDWEFETSWLSFGTAYTARPNMWRLYPGPSQLQVWPAPDATSATATCLIEYTAPPAALADAADIEEILIEDVPTILAGCYRHGLKFQDETVRDLPQAEIMWTQGIIAMRQRQTKAQMHDRYVQIRFRDY